MRFTLCQAMARAPVVPEIPHEPLPRVAWDFQGLPYLLTANPSVRRSKASAEAIPRESGTPPLALPVVVPVESVSSCILC